MAARQVPVLLLLAALMAGCHYRLPDPIAHTDLDLIRQRTSGGYGEWTRKGVLWTSTVWTRSKSTFKIAHDDGRTFRGECRRVHAEGAPRGLLLPEHLAYAFTCKVLEDEDRSFVTVTLRWEDERTHVADITTSEHVLHLRSGQGQQIQLPGTVMGYDVETPDGDVIGAVSYVGKPGVLVRRDVPAEVRSALSLGATVVYVAHFVDSQSDVSTQLILGGL